MAFEIDFDLGNNKWWTTTVIIIYNYQKGK